MLPLAASTDVGPGDEVVLAARTRTILCGPGLLGRIVDPLGIAVDGGPPIADGAPWPLERSAPDPLLRRPVDQQFITGLRCIDGCLAIGRGQRIGLFAGPGLGKSTLLGALARRSDCDVSVICLVGERGREVSEFIKRVLGDQGMSRSVVVLATADSPLLLRVQALETATAVAEWHRAQGRQVLLLVDSLTRAVRARRDVALALGESPARGGFPASAFSSLPLLLERAGCGDKGSITAIYAVLTEEGRDDPTAEEARSLLDGHIALSPDLARAGKWPAVDILRSVSRVMDAVAPKAQIQAAKKLCAMLSAYRENEDLIMMGAYRKGGSRETDMALERKAGIDDFLCQGLDEASPIEATRTALEELVK
jgi:FliI/YscN family ATPase